MVNFNSIYYQKNNRIEEKMFEFIKGQPHYSFIMLDENTTEYRVDIKTGYGSLFKDVIVIKS